MVAHLGQTYYKQKNSNFSVASVSVITGLHFGIRRLSEICFSISKSHLSLFQYLPNDWIFPFAKRKHLYIVPCTAG